jgi:acetate kinase
MPSRILVANIGSTSFKYRLFGMEPLTVMGQGRVERIGEPGSACLDYEAAIQSCLDDLVGAGKPLAKLAELSAVGFKAVHAGPISGAHLVNQEVLAAMEEFSFFAPAHNPPYLAAMRAFGKIRPELPLVALFETAFFDTLDEAAITYAVPYSWKQQDGVRRYGFHGASHRAASERAQELLGRTDLRHICCHLGGSSSMAAIRSGLAVDCSFGMSPQSGLPHNNRVGDLDAFAILYMMKKHSLSVDRMASILASESGLAGIAGGSGDVRDLSLAAESGDARAQLALDVFLRAIRHYLGAFLVTLGGVDVLTFSGGIGENSALVREQVCKGLETFGIELDTKRNRGARLEQKISADQSPVTILILPADEERIVARATAAVIGGLGSRAAVPTRNPA